MKGRLFFCCLFLIWFTPFVWAEGIDEQIKELVEEMSCRFYQNVIEKSRSDTTNFREVHREGQINIKKDSSSQSETTPPSRPKKVESKVGKFIQDVNARYYQDARIRIMSDVARSPGVESEGQVYGYWVPGVECSADKWGFKLWPKVWFSRGFGLDQDWDVECLWDQAYLSLDSGRSRWTVGWQKFTWGKLDKIEFLDMVNPYDLRWFYTWDKEDRKEPLLSLSWQWDADNWWVDLVAVPRFGHNRYLYFNSDWAQFGRIKESFVNYSQVQDIEIVSPDWTDSYSLHNSELFLRWGSTVWETDLDLYLFYGYNRVPGLYGSRTVKHFLYQPSPDTLLGLLGTSSDERKIVEFYRRDIIVGADFEATVGDFGIRGEVGYSRDVPVLRDDFALVSRDEFAVGLGVDYTSPNDWYFNLQLIWQTIQDYPGLVAMERNSFIWVANLRKNMLDGDLVLDVDLVIRTPYGDSMFNPELSYRLNDFSKIVLGGFWFNGASSSLFGAKRENDRVYTELEFSF